MRFSWRNHRIYRTLCPIRATRKFIEKRARCPIANGSLGKRKASRRFQPRFKRKGFEAILASVQSGFSPVGYGRKGARKVALSSSPLKRVLSPTSTVLIEKVFIPISVPRIELRCHRPKSRESRFCLPILRRRAESSSTQPLASLGADS